MLAEIVDVRQETQTVKTIRLKLPEHIDFKAGQFIMVYGNVEKDGKTQEIKRAYSISSSPSDKECIEFTFNIVPGGILSTVLYSMKKGDKLKIEGPYGVFIFEPGEGLKEVVFMCGGTGITPLMCMCRDLTKTHPGIRKVMLYSIRTSDDIIFKEELYKMAEENSSFELGITVTRDDKEWQGHRGRIGSDFIKMYVKDFGGALFYVCGPQKFIQSMISILKENGVKPEKIKLEAWG